jgi:tetratricopeptide (TPR) repeat protein
MGSLSKRLCMSKSILSGALAVVLAAGAMMASPAWAAEAKNTVSKAAAKPLKAGSDAMTAKNYTECVAKAKEGAATEGHTAFDTFVANQLLGFCYAKLGNSAEAAAAYDAQLNSGFLPADQAASMTKTLAGVYYGQKDYAKSVELGTKAIKSGSADAGKARSAAQGTVADADARRL